MIFKKGGKMETFIKLIINISLLLGSGYCATKLLFDVEEMVTKRVKRGFSSSEDLARNLTNTRLPF